MSDSGLWFVNGKVCAVAERDRVWAAYNKKWDAMYEKRVRTKARHRKELAMLDKEMAAVEATRPCTPWVGRADEGPIEKFVAIAKRRIKNLWQPRDSIG